MCLTYKNGAFILIVLLIQCCNSHGACPSLISTETLTITCEHNNKTLDNCNNAMEGTEAYITCNMFYEETTLEAYPKRICRNNRWNSPIPQCYPICGHKRVNDSSNREKDQNILLDYPWYVGIYLDESFRCGGTLIAMNMALSAARCVAYSGEYTIIPEKIERISVSSGKYYVGYDDNRDKFAQYSAVHELHFPEEYNLYSRFDMAILVLTDPFLPSQVVQPVCLNFDPSSYNSLIFDSGILTGRHLISEANNTGSKVVRVLYISNSECDSYFNRNHKNYHISLSSEEICGRNLDNVTIACFDDVGGGLVLRNKINDRYYLVGILSQAALEENITKCHPNDYSLYTAVSHFQNFVENLTRNIEIKNCVLPNHPQLGKYSLFLNKSEIFEYEVGYSVTPHTKLSLICDVGYHGSTKYYCSKNGQWNPPLSGCTVNAPDQVISPLNKSTTFNYNYVILIVAVMIIFLALLAVTLYKLKYKQEWEIKKEIKLAGLYRFHNGNLKSFNPELDIGNQAEFLPYNNNFEFPRDKLKLGKQLGSGAFGVVMQADAFGIIPNEERTIVAVKTAKNIADHVQIKALISELKIMIHLGQHLNVVNLLGACTQNITKRELLVIVEYCQFGNLYNHLLRNRENYIDQMDNVTGNIDYSFGIEDLANVLAVPDNSCTLRETDLQISSSVSNNSCNNNQSELSSNISRIHTKDLISWSFQVARGMEYLASRKIFHGDLAARNILLADNNIVKISDFGLAKRLHQSMNYKKQQDSPLPIKWMAVESIRDRVFSTQSDVWSFGIVLWELFSLAQTPYPGMEANERLYYKLLDGYKMKPPPYAPMKMYNIMCDCWSFNPASRPSFNELAGRIGLMLEENVRQLYIDLNDPYLVINMQKLKENQTDYLGMLNPPRFRQISIPNDYIKINDNQNNRPVGGSEYLCLTTNDPAINIAVKSLNNEELPSLPNEHAVVEV